jgi:hypothetical protein
VTEIRHIENRGCTLIYKDKVDDSMWCRCFILRDGCLPLLWVCFRRLWNLSGVANTHPSTVLSISVKYSVRTTFPTSSVSAFALDPHQRILHATRRCEAARTLIRMRRLRIIRGVPCFADALLPHAPNVTLGTTRFPSIPDVHRNPYKITHEAWQQITCRHTCKSWISAS